MSPIDTALSVRVGETFTVNGREFTRRSYSLDGYEDRVVLAVWNSCGKATGVTVRDSYKVEVAR